MIACRAFIFPQCPDQDREYAYRNLQFQYTADFLTHVKKRSSSSGHILATLVCAPTRNRTQNSTSEASRDIRFTIGACLS